MIHKNTNAFSFVEIIISVSIIILLALVGITASNNYVESVKNAKVTQDIQTLDNAIQAFYQQKSTLPDPAGNNNYFNEDTSYAHSASGAYGNHGFVTQETLPKSILDILPLDPRTNQYYAYGKLLSQNQYEVAGINWIDSQPVSFVDGNYAAETGPYNLIREYNGPEFVSDGNKNHFPYNPEERVLVAQIKDLGGIVRINDTINATQEILNYTLKAWDKVTVEAGWFAEIYFSDGTTSILWDDFLPSELIMAEMTYKDENNIFTKIRLVLGGGTIWSKATHLADESEFEIYTTDSSAAVRGTVFGLSKSDSTDIFVSAGKVEVNNVTYNPGSRGTILWEVTTQDITQALENDTNDTTNPYLQLNAFSTSTSSNIDYDGNEGKSYIEVVPGDPIEGIKVDSWYSYDSSFPTIQEGTILEKINETIIEGKKFNTNISFFLERFQYDADNNELHLEIKIDEVIRDQADFILISYDGNQIIQKISNIISTNGNDLLVDINHNTIFRSIDQDWYIGTSTSAQKLGLHLDLINGNTIPEWISLSFWKFDPYKQTAIEDEIINRMQESYYFEETHEFWMALLKNTWDGETEFQHNINYTQLLHPIYIPLIPREYTQEKSIDGSHELIIQATEEATCANSFFYTPSWSTPQCAPADSDLTHNGWQLVGYAPYNQENDINLYMPEEITATLNASGIIWNTAALPMDCMTDSSLCTTWWEQWIYIDSNGVDGADYIKYNWLGITWDFSIEVHVPGSALNRNHHIPYTLLQLWTQALTLQDWSLKFQGIHLFNISWFNDNQIYKVIFTNNNVSIEDTWLSSTISPIWSTQLYIWNRDNFGSYVHQWNDIINSIKIYEK